MYRVHYFDTSEAAHDACLDDGPCIEKGDVLAILSEGVIGLASTDPIAVTLDPGALRIVRPMAMDTLLTELVHDACQIRRAVAIACSPATPTPITKARAAGIVPAAVIIIGKARP